MIALAAPAEKHGRADELNGFDTSGALVPEESILHGGPPRDGIPAIDEPRFVSPAEARRMYSSRTRAIVVRRGGEVKVYPFAVLNWHEVVNDVVGGEPLAITYCPLCGTGVVFAARVDGKTLRFGVSGLVYQSDVLLYDRDSKSLWSQLLRKAISGKHRGRTLEVVSSRIEVLDSVLREEDEARVLSTDTGYRRSYDRDPYAGYGLSRSIYFPVEHSDEAAHPKSWSILIEAESDAVIVSVARLDPAKRRVGVTIGETAVTLAYDTSTNTIHCAEPIDGVTCLNGYYFALRTFYPTARFFVPEERGAAQER